MSRPPRRSIGSAFAEPTDTANRRSSVIRRRSVSPSRENERGNASRLSLAGPPKHKAVRRSLSTSQLPDGPRASSRVDDLGSNETLVRVAIRIRPFNPKEVAAGTTGRRIVSVLDDQQVVFDPLSSRVLDEDGHEVAASAFHVPGTRREKNISYSFDRIFKEAATQKEVYEGTAKPLVDAVLQGYNATVFAYGATGCGKTHTITGLPSDPGLIFRTMEDLFDKIQSMQEEHVVEASLSYLEVYNETIRDLLSPDTAPHSGLDLREDDNGVVVAGLSKHEFQGTDDVMNKLIQGNNNRSKAPTEANQTSSRSHAVLQVHIQHKDRASGAQASWTKAVLSIIDLAGSERASATKNRGERLHEGAKINRSLLALGNCINALCKPGANAQHVPYRDSKLTRLLKHSLGGNCRVVMIANISPHPMHYEETHNTLMYANRAKEIRTRSEVNRFEVEAGVDQYRKIIEDLQQQLQTLRDRTHQTEGPAAPRSATAGQSLLSSAGMVNLRDVLFPTLRRQRLVVAQVADRVAQLEHKLALARGVVDVFWAPGADAAVFDFVREESALIAEEVKFNSEFCRERLVREQGRVAKLEQQINAAVGMLRSACSEDEGLFLSDFLATSRTSLDLDVAREEIRLARDSGSALARWTSEGISPAILQLVASLGQENLSADSLAIRAEEGSNLVRENLLKIASLEASNLPELPPEQELSTVFAASVNAVVPSLMVQPPSDPKSEEVSEQEEDARFAAEIAAKERQMETEEEQAWEQQAQMALAGFEGRAENGDREAATPSPTHGQKRSHEEAMDTEESPVSKKHEGPRTPDSMEAEEEIQVATPKAETKFNFAPDLLRSALKNVAYTPPQATMTPPDGGTPKAGGASAVRRTTIVPAAGSPYGKIERKDSQNGGVGPMRVDSPAKRRDRRSMIPIPSAGPLVSQLSTTPLAKPKSTASGSAAAPGTNEATVKKSGAKRRSMLPAFGSPKMTRSKAKK